MESFLLIDYTFLVNATLLIGILRSVQIINHKIVVIFCVGEFAVGEFVCVRIHRNSFIVLVTYILTYSIIDHNEFYIEFK